MSKNRGRQPWTPSKRDFDIAWNIHRQGGYVKDICEALQISNILWRKWRTRFNEYFVQSGKLESELDLGVTPHSELVKSVAKAKNKTLPPPPHTKVRVTNGPGKPKGTRKLNMFNIDLDKVRRMAQCNFTHEKIAMHLGISNSTLKNYRKEYEALDLMIKTGKDTLGMDVVDALRKRALGYNVTQEEFISTPSGIKKVKKTTHIPANVNAGKFIATNTVGWGNEPQRDSISNKGTIVDFLDKLAEDGDNE